MQKKRPHADYWPMSRKSKTQLPLVSVVMPSFNTGQFIERSLLSLIDQKYPNLEVIVIDGGSTDGTLEIIRKYEAHISYWISEPDKGQSDALNKGFELANGKIFGWLNSDDVYLPGAISKAVSALQLNTKKLICFGDWVSIDVNDQVIMKQPAFDYLVNHLIYEGFPLNAQAMFWRKEVHTRFSGFDRRLNYTMDYQMMLEFGLNEGNAAFLRLPYSFGGFRRYTGQKTAGYTPEVHAEHIYIAKRYGLSDKYTWTGKLKRILYRIRRGYWYFKREGPIGVMKRLLRKG